MSDQDPDATTGDEVADNGEKGSAAGAEQKAASPASPSPRPRSAASRARRIGGAAAAPRSDAADAKPDAPTVDTTKKAKAGKSKDSAAPDDDARGKVAGKSAKRAKPVKETDDEESGKPAAAALTFSVPGWVRWAPGFVFAAVAVVFLSLFAAARIGGDDAPESTSSSMRQEVLAAAKTCLATLNTYRYDQLTQAETAGARCTTGKLTSDYKKTVTTVIKKNAPPLKAIQVAKINTAGIESVTKNGKQWTILAYGQLNITTANTGKQGQIDPFAVVARMQQVNGKWVLSKIDTVSSFTR